MTRITDEVRPTTGTYVQQDYSPGYDILVENDSVGVGTRIRVNSNASTGSANLVSIDVNDPIIVAELNAAYPLAWPAMYGTTYQTEDAQGNSNALKLVKAVELWLYLNNFETTNIDENLQPTNIKPASAERDPYSSYLDNRTPYRVPPETMWNREVFYDGSGNRVDQDGNQISDIYVDENGSPVFRIYDKGTKEELNVLILSLQIAAYKGNLPNSIPSGWFTNGELTKTTFNDTELQTIRDANLLFSKVVTLLPYSPYTLQGSRVLATKFAGSYAQALMSTDYLAKTEYETVLTRPKREHEWGGPYATGRNTF